MTKVRLPLPALAGVLLAGAAVFAASQASAQQVPDIRAECVSRGYRPGSLRYDRCIEALAYAMPLPVQSCPTGPNPFRREADQLYPQCYGTAAAPYATPRY